jgi:hypothetical protein
VLKKLPPSGISKSVCTLNPGTTTERPAGPGSKRVRFVRPNYLRIDQMGPGDSYVLYFDGSSGWEILPAKRVADLVGRELPFAQG